MVRAAALAFILLAGCDNAPQRWTQAEIEDIAADASAPDADVSEMAATIARLEARVAKLEKEQSEDIDMLRRITQGDADSGKWSDEAFDRLFKNDETLRSNVNWLLARQGAPQIPRAD